MELKRLLHDDDAVSPVIGVILMVAITVILAAVIASFVLGLGDSTQKRPTANFDFEYDGSADNDDSDADGVVSITHGGGDTVSADEVYIRGEGTVDPDGTKFDTTSTGKWLGTGETTDKNGESVISAGNSLRVGVSADYTLRVVWETAEGDTSATLAENSGPDA
jgi:flagellin-like protein